MTMFLRGLLFLGLASAAAAACTTFDTAGSPGSDATAPLPVVTDSAPAPVDANTVDDAMVPGPDCARGPKGVADACAGCSGETFYTPTLADAGLPDSGITGPHIFGIVSDGVSVFWLEQVGVNSYNGVGGTTAVKRKKIAGGTAETMIAFSGAFTRLAVNGKWLWMAGNKQGQPIRAIDKTCGASGPACAPQDSAFVEPVSALIPYDTGVAVAIPNGRQLITFPSPGVSPSRTTPLHPIDGLVEWKSKLAVVAESPETANTISLYPGAITIPLGADPANPALPSVGAHLLASTCDDLWAYQIFKSSDGGNEVHTALVNVASPSPRAIPINALTFAIGADTTHVYAGLPNGGGLRRAARADGTAPVVIGGVSVFSLAVTDDLVIYDDHGTIGSARSVGIFTMKKAK